MAKKKTYISNKSRFEFDTMEALAENGLMSGIRYEYRFHDARRWRADFAWPRRNIILECEGLSWRKGPSRHTTPKGFTDDAEKYNTATVNGWRVIRITQAQLKDGSAMRWMRAMFGRTD